MVRTTPLAAITVTAVPLAATPAHAVSAASLATSLTINGQKHELALAPETPLLWVLRDHLGLVGTKFGCGRGFCGACTVHVDGDAVRACITTLESVASQSVTTIEGLSADGSHPLQRAWIEVDVPQCGYCQAGQIMTAAAFLAKQKNPSEAEIAAAMAGNLCRCATYQRIKKAVQQAAATVARDSEVKR